MLTQYYNKLLQNIIKTQPASVLLVTKKVYQNLTIVVHNRSNILFLFYYFKLSSFYRLQTLVECTVIDTLDRLYRFKIIYCLLSVVLNTRLNVSYIFSKDGFNLQSLNSIYNSASWLEREIYDMFGCWFKHHSNLRRILTDYGFKGYPLRKDFPLTGFYEVYYDIALNKLKYVKLKLSQQFKFLGTFKLSI